MRRAIYTIAIRCVRKTFNASPEIMKFAGLTSRKGLYFGTAVALFFRFRVKMEVGLCRGKNFTISANRRQKLMQSAKWNVRKCAFLKIY